MRTISQQFRFCNRLVFDQKMGRLQTWMWLMWLPAGPTDVVVSGDADRTEQAVACNTRHAGPHS